MSELRIVVIPVGRMNATEIEGALGRVAKVLNRPVELREAAPVPRSAEDTTRSQYGSAPFLAEVRRSLPRLKVAQLVGAPSAGSPVPTPKPDAAVFVTDLDLFTPSTEGVFGELDTPHRAALLSVRRLREAFYRRKADPAKQRSRLVKQLLRAIGLLQGLPNCSDPSCSMSAAQVVADIDRKKERYCGPCWKRMSTGAFNL
jgi:predicted Zn-dependent protease